MPSLYANSGLNIYVITAAVNLLLFHVMFFLSVDKRQILKHINLDGKHVPKYIQVFMNSPQKQKRRLAFKGNHKQYMGTVVDDGK